MSDIPLRGRREQRRADLVQAAIRAVRRIGAAVSVADIAAAAGITKPILYRHFVDPADLQAAVGEQAATVLLARVSDELGRDRSPVEQTRAVIDVVLACVEEDPELWRFVTHRSTRSVEAQIVDHVRGRIAQLPATLLGDELRLRGQDSGGAEVWAQGLVGMVHSTAEWWLGHRTVSRATLADDLTALAWSGVACIFPPRTGILGDLSTPAPSTPSTH
jgi:AcrR family transcriptional regulator